MECSSFGKFVRILRIKHNEVMGDMAKVLGVSPPFLSAVENGKKNVPSEWIEKLVEHYDLTDTEQTELRRAIEESKTVFKIAADKAGTNQRRAAYQFARSFDDMDDATAIKILEILNNGRGRN